MTATQSPRSRFITTDIDEFDFGDEGGGEESPKEHTLSALPAEPESPDAALDALATPIRTLARRARAALLDMLSRRPLGSALAVAQEWAAEWAPQLAELSALTHLSGSVAGMSSLASLLEAPEPYSAVPQWVESAGEELPLVRAALESLAHHRLLSLPDWSALRQNAGNQGMMQAQEQVAAVTSRVRDALAESLSGGGTLPQFKRKLAESLDESGALSPAHAEAVFRTNVMAAYSDGQERMLADPKVGRLFPYAAYHATHDGRVRPEHLEMERRGIGGSNIYRRDDPVFQLFRPPWAPQCRCIWNPLSLAEAARRGVAEAAEWQRTGIEPANKAFVEMPPFRPDAGFGGAELSAAEGEWQHYEGEHGGKGWKNSQTGEVRYQKDRPGGGSNPGAQALHEVGSRQWKATRRSIKDAIRAKAGAAGALGDLATRMGAAAWNALPLATQDRLKATWAMAGAVGHHVEHQLTKLRRGSQELVDQVVAERKLPPQVAKATLRAVKTADAILSWTENVPLAHEVLHTAAHAGSVESFALAKVAFYIPVGSLAYLAYSTARNPFAVYRAARKAVALARLPRAKPVESVDGGKHLSTLDDGADRSAIGSLADFLASATNTDAALAMVLAALDETGGDLAAAVELAVAASKGDAAELSAVDADDIDSWTEPTGYELAGESGRYQQRRVTRGPRTGDVGWYDTQGKRFMPRDWKPGGVKVRVAEKAAAGAADRQALSERLGRHAAGHEANAVQRAWAKSAARMLVRHHGEGAAHRVEELAHAAEGALSRVSGDGSHARWAREVLKGKLRQLHLALGEINAAQKQTSADDEFGRKQAAQKQLDMGQAPLPAGSRPEKDEAAVDAAIRWARKHEADFGKIKMAAEGSAAKGRTREQFLGRFGTQLDAAGKKAVGDYYDAVKAELKAEPMPQPQPKAEPKEKAKPLDMKSAHAALMKAGLKLDKKQREAVDFYAGSGYKGINKALRGGDASNRYIPPLDAAIAAAPPLPEGVTVYRGLEFMDDGERDDFVKTLTGEVTFPAYVSTSLDGQSAEHFSRRLRGAGVMLEIVPKHGLYVPAARIGDGDEDEFELLMRRGSRFRVAGRREAKGGAPVYRLEEIDNA